MIEDAADCLDDLMAPEESDGAPTKARGGLWTRAVAVNSVELELMEQADRDPAQVVDVECLEIEGVEAETTARPEPTEMDFVRAAISEYWRMRRAIARSLGSGGTWERY